jgi:hypothetical protein
MMDILRANDQLNAGSITIEHARALTGNFKAAIKLISSELDAAKFTGRVDKTLQRWFRRVHESCVDNSAMPVEIIEQLREIVQMASKPKSKPARKTRAASKPN